MSTQKTTTAEVIERSDLPTNMEKIGSGGEGVVYKLGKTSFSSTPCAFKEYKSPNAVNEKHLEMLVKYITKLGEVAPERRDWLLQKAAWPTHLVRDGEKIVGIIMPLIPTRFFRFLSPTASSMSKRAAELQYLLNGAAFEQSIGLQVTEKQRYEFLEDFATLLRILHGAGVRVGDISVKNLLFCHDSPGSHVYLLDCDSMSIGTSLGPDIQTPGWDVPNEEKPQTIESDSYKFGLLSLRLLASDQSTRNPNDLPASAPVSLKNLTHRALASPASERPQPKDWLGAIQEGKQSASTQPAQVLTEEKATTADSATGTTKTVSRRTSAHAKPKVNNTVTPSTSPTTPATTGQQAIQTSASNDESKEKKKTALPAFLSFANGLIVVYNFAVGHPEHAVKALIVMIICLIWLGIAASD